MKIHHHLLASLLLAAASNAHAVYTINILEAGGNVVINGSGSINTTGMISNGSVQACANGRVGPISLCLGTSPIGLQFVGVVSPALTALTTGAFTNGNASSGQPVYIANSDLFLPAGYVSASPLAGSATFNGQTFAGLGLTAGSRTLTLTSGDSIEIGRAHV